MSAPVVIQGESTTDQNLAIPVKVTPAGALLVEGGGGGSSSAGYAVASDGQLLDLESLAQTFNRDGNGDVSSIDVSVSGNTYRQTFTRDGNGDVTQISAWELQA